MKNYLFKSKSKHMDTNEALINAVIKQILEDVNYSDMTAIHELLSFIPKENLIQFLPEEEWSKY